MHRVKVETRHERRRNHTGCLHDSTERTREETRESEERVFHYRREERREGRKMRLKGSVSDNFGGENSCDPDPAMKGQQIGSDWSRKVKQ